MYILICLYYLGLFILTTQFPIYVDIKTIYDGPTEDVSNMVEPKSGRCG